MIIRPISFKDACSYIATYHRHHKPPQGWKFGVSARDDDGIIHGVAMIGRPVSRMIDQDNTLEVIRLCTDGSKNACSMLYGSCRRIAKEMGYARIITYILASESGTSLKASGWVMTGETSGGSWSRPSRGRTDDHPLEKKQRWEGWANVED